MQRRRFEVKLMTILGLMLVSFAASAQPVKGIKSSDPIVDTAVSMTVMNCLNGNAQKSKLCTYVSKTLEERVPKDLWLEEFYSSLNAVVSEMKMACYPNIKLEICEDLRTQVDAILKKHSYEIVP